MYKYENCQQFLEDFCYFKDYFPMVQDYLIKDNCYSDDDWIEWYSVYEGDVIVAFLAFRKTPLISESSENLTSLVWDSKSSNSIDYTN